MTFAIIFHCYVCQSYSMVACDIPENTEAERPLRISGECSHCGAAIVRKWKTFRDFLNSRLIPPRREDGSFFKLPDETGE